MQIVGLVLLVWAGQLAAAFYQAPWSTGWQLAVDKLSCRVTQDIPHLGRAVFRQDAGKPLTFSLRLNAGAEVSEASVQIRPAPWQHRVLPSRRYLAAPMIGDQETAEIGVRGPVAEQMLAALFAGRFPAFIYRRSWQGGADEYQVSVSAVRFWEVYDGFQHCRSQLPPYGIEDFRNLRFYFPEHRIQLPPGGEVKLRRLALLLQRLGKGQVVVTDVGEGLGGQEGRFWFTKRYRRIRQLLLQAGLKPAQVVTKPAGAGPRIDLALFGPEGLRRYHYGRQQQDLTRKQKRRLRLLARYLTEYFTGDLVIDGYSDGARWRSEKTNRAISRRWAEKVRDYLVGQGVAAARMKIRVWGSRHRVASNLTKAGQARNRRVLVRLVEAQPTPAGGY